MPGELAKQSILLDYFHFLPRSRWGRAGFANAISPNFRTAQVVTMLPDGTTWQSQNQTGHQSSGAASAISSDSESPRDADRWLSARWNSRSSLPVLANTDQPKTSKPNPYLSTRASISSSSQNRGSSVSRDRAACTLPIVGVTNLRKLGFFFTRSMNTKRPASFSLR